MPTERLPDPKMGKKIYFYHKQHRPEFQRANRNQGTERASNKDKQRYWHLDLQSPQTQMSDKSTIT